MQTDPRIIEAAEKYADRIFGFANENHNDWQSCQGYFIDGINSQINQILKLEAQIELLQKIGFEYSINLSARFIIDENISELQYQLEELKKQL